MKRAWGISSFYIEIILVLFFLGVSATAAIQLFAGAHTTIQNSSRLSSAILVAQTCAETALSAHTPNELQRLFSGNEVQVESNTAVAICGYDRNWQSTADEPSYLAHTKAEFTQNAPGTAVTVTVTVSEYRTGSAPTELFSLSAFHYYPAGQVGESGVL